MPTQQARAPCLETIAKRERVVAALKQKFVSLGLEPRTCEKWLPRVSVLGKRSFETQAHACRELLRRGALLLDAILMDLETRHSKKEQLEPPVTEGWRPESST